MKQKGTWEIVPKSLVSGGGGNRIFQPENATSEAPNELCKSSQNGTANVLQVCDSDCLRLSLVDTDLARIINAWSELPKHIRMAMTALVGVAVVR
jgi:hypothetical protein